MISPAHADTLRSFFNSLGVSGDQLWLLTWGVLIVSLLAIVVASVFLVRGLFRASHGPAKTSDTTPVERPAAGPGWLTIGAGVVAFALFLSAVLSMATLGQIGHPPQEPAFTIEMTGHRWWWEVRYVGDDSSRAFTTANEIRIPVGKTVRVELKSADVIHAFWVPALGGKTDLIPGRTNVTWIEAAKPGVYRGQCAEFCGLQHAHMALLVVAEEPDVFQDWWDKQLKDAPEVEAAPVERGKQAFIQKCGICHTVRGTAARGVIGPDLSHLMQRRTLAAGTVPNTPGHLATWIANPQQVKPGNLMPQPDLTAVELKRVLAFLQTLE